MVKGIYRIESYSSSVPSPDYAHLHIILERAETLSSSNPGLVPQLLPLDLGPVQHVGKETSDVGVGLLENVGEVGGGIGADGPLGRSELPLVAEEPVVEQLGALGVGRVLEDGCGLGPSDVGCVGRASGVDATAARATASAKGSNVGGVGEGELGAGGSASTNPGRVLGEKGVEPFDTELLDTGRLVSSD